MSPEPIEAIFLLDDLPGSGRRICRNPIDFIASRKRIFYTGGNTLPRKPVLKLEDIQQEDGTPHIAGGWILDKPLPKRAKIDFLEAAYAACLECLTFYSSELVWYPSFVQSLDIDAFDKQKALKDAKKCIWECTAKLWEICQRIADVTEKDARKEFKEFQQGKRSDIAEKLHGMGFCSADDLEAYKKRGRRFKIGLPPPGPDDPF